jgi:glycosyltransferase involved in cell wall biosynthesis
MMLSDVGVVIIGRNEGEKLCNCIDSVKMANGNIVYVDSGSTDGSLEFARQSGITVVSLDPSRIFTAARARNEGFDALKAISPHLRWVQFIDGDCVLVLDWLQKATMFIAGHPEIAVVCGRRRERFPEASIYNRFIDMEWNTPHRRCSGLRGGRNDAH